MVLSGGKYFLQNLTLFNRLTGREVVFILPEVINYEVHYYYYKLLRSINTLQCHVEHVDQ